MIVYILQGLLVVAAVILLAAWFAKFTKTKEPWLPSPVSVVIGAVTNFFDTLGIGSFAPTTAAIKGFRLTADENIPGTLNVGHALPTIVQAFVYLPLILVFKVDVAMVIVLVAASVLGALIGSRIVSGLPRRPIQAGMGVALIVAAALYAARNLGMIPGDGTAVSLEPTMLAAAAGLFFVYGALMTLGIGLYAPAMITVGLFGMNPALAFPIMTSACAYLMPAASMRFIRSGRIAPKIVTGLALGGIPAVLVAAFIVKELDVNVLRWVVAGVVAIVGVMMLASAMRGPDETATPRVQR